jgi:nucleotide-binding universal stress UspA family protein
VSVAEDEDADVIAMATHGRTGLARLLMGSVATRTIETAKKPVLLVRPSSLGRISSGEGLAVAER